MFPSITIYYPISRYYPYCSSIVLHEVASFRCELSSSFDQSLRGDGITLRYARVVCTQRATLSPRQRPQASCDEREIPELTIVMQM